MFSAVYYSAIVIIGGLAMDRQDKTKKNEYNVIFPVAPKLAEMSDSYLTFIED